MFYDGQGREPAGCSFLLGGCLALCILLDSLSVNALAVIRLRWRRVVRALFFTAILFALDLSWVGVRLLQNKGDKRGL